MTLLRSRAALAALFLALAAPALGQSGPPAPPMTASQADPDFTVINESGRSVFYIRLRAPGAGAWGDDLLGLATVLRTDGRFLVRPPRDGRCEWDLLLRFDNEVERVFPSVPACRIASLRVTPDLAATSGSTRIVAEGSAPPPAPPQPPPTPPAAATPRLTVVNGWTVAVRTIGLRPPGRPATDADWGPDLLGEDVIPPGSRMSVRLPEGTPCRVDLRIVFDMPNAGLQRLLSGVELCEGRDVTANGPPPGVMMGTGTGFFVTRQGHIATNEHVVRGCATSVILTATGERVPLRLLQADRANDLALLHLPAGASPAVRFRDPARPLRQGETLLAMGYPLGSRLGNQVTINIGILAAPRGFQGGENMFTLSTPVNGGNSGGPVFDDGGLVVGVISSGITSAQNVNFGVPLRYLFAMMERLGIPQVTEPPGEPMKPVDLFERNAPMVMQLGCIS